MKAANQWNPAIILPVEKDWADPEVMQRALDGSEIYMELRRMAVIVDSSPPFLPHRAGLARRY